MPMPTLMAKKYMMKKAARFFQEKKKSAAMAPTWKSPHGDGGDPVDAALLVLAAHAEVLLDLLGDFGDGRDDRRPAWGRSLLELLRMVRRGVICFAFLCRFTA